MRTPGGAAALTALFTLFALLLSAAAPLRAQAAEPPLKILDVRLGVDPGVTRIVIDSDRAFPYRIFSLASPYRVVLDLPEFTADDNAALQGTGTVERLRLGLFRPGVGRLVVDAAEPVTVAKHFRIPPQQDKPHRLVLELKRVAASAFSAVKTASDDWAGYEDGLRPDAAVAAKPREGPTTPLVFLDPGHGGPDPGAVGVSGLHEKQVTLAVAKAVRDLLQRSGRYRVQLTRDRDIYIPLRDRYRMAEEAGADLFISLHADNIGRRNVRGASVYTLSTKASDREAEKLAAAENRSDLIAGMDLSEYDDVVARVLLDFEQGATMEQSVDFAGILVEDLNRETLMLTRPHRFAGFAVLKSPAVPSVLLEMGFLSNRQDERLLRSNDHQRRIAEAVFRAVERYFKHQEQLRRS